MTRKDIKHLVSFAARRAAEEGQRWTEMRAHVYEALLAQESQATAYQLIAVLSEKLKKDLKPASVYRALDALCALGVVVRIESLNAFRACAHPEHQHQHVFLVCDSCGMADEIADHGIGRKLTRDAAEHGFRTARQVLELHGACRGCQT